MLQYMKYPEPIANIQQKKDKDKMNLFISNLHKYVEIILYVYIYSK